MRILPIVFSALLVIALEPVLVQIGHAETVRPNIVFLLTDDHRADALGCYGNPIVRTPNLDQLARDGVLFENAFVTSAICTPSRACFLLGQYERRHGINFNSGTSMAPEAWKKSYPVLLREAGYFTGYVGKNHVPIGPQGYETGLMDESFDFWYAGHGHLKFYPKEHHDIFDHAKSDTQVEVIGEGAASFLQSTDDFIEGAKSFISHRDVDKPFCLSIAFNVPHAAGTGSMKLRDTDGELYLTRYRDQIGQLPLPSTYVPRSAIEEPKLPADVSRTEFRQKVYNYVDDPGSLRERHVREYQTVTGVDRLLGSLRSQLSELGIEDNTIIVFASDHGIMNGEFGLGGKALNYEPCLHIPMIVMDPRHPESQRGRRLDHLVMSIDVAPTIMDWAGVSIPNTVQGRSLLSLLAQGRAAWREVTFAENLWSTIFGNPRCESVRTKRWKYIRYFANDRELYKDVPPERIYNVIPGQSAAYASWLTSSILGEQPDYEELFDLQNDPDETTNLTDDSRYAQKLATMRSHCQQLVREAKGDVDAKPLTLPLPAGTGTK